MPAIDTQHGKKAPPRSRPKTRRPTAAEIMQAAGRRRREAIQQTIETKAEQATTRRQSLAAEQGYRSQGRAVRLAASPRARRADTRARQLREMRTRSRAQEAAYASQGRSVELNATLQKLARQGLASAARGTTPGKRVLGVKVSRDLPGRELVESRTSKSFGRKGGREFSLIGKTPSELAEIVEATTEKRWNGTRRIKQPDAALKGLRGVAGKRTQIKSQELSAPGRLLLDVAMRPVNLTAGAADAALKGKNPIKGAIEGATTGDKRKRKTFSDVLAAHGVSGPAKGILGFVLDVGLDPTTYISLGATSIARETAIKAAREAAITAERASLRAAAERGEITAAIRQTAKERGRAAGAAALKQASHKAEMSAPAAHLARGLDVRVAGKRLPGVTRATAAVRHATSRGAEHVGGRNIPLKRTEEGERILLGAKALDVKHAAQNLGAELNANVRRAGQTRAQQAGVKALQREARADEEVLNNQVRRRLKANVGRLKGDERQRVIDAIENQKIGALKGTARKVKTIRPTRIRGARDADRLHTLAKRIDADLKYLHRQGRRAGTITGTVGKAARTRAEIQIGQHVAGRTEASLTKVQQELNVAGKELKAARTAQTRAAKPSDRIAARRRATAARQRFDNLSAKRDAVRQQIADRQTATTARRTRTKQRTSSEAAGYFPRLTKEQVKSRSLLERFAAPLDENFGISTEKVGANKPEISSAQRRGHRETRAEIAKDPERSDLIDDLSSDVLKSVGVYAGSVARANAARNLNLKAIERFGEKIPRNISERQLRDLHREGKGVYRVKGGTLQELVDHSMVNAVSKRTKGGAGGVGGGQVAVLDRKLVAQIRNHLPGEAGRAGKLLDVPIRAFKTVALTTPAYLVRNLVGDTYNAMGDERFWRLMRNQARGQKTLSATGRKEGRQGAFKLDPEQVGQTRAALRKFRDALPGDRHTVKLTDEQAQQIAKALDMPPGSVSRKIPAEAVALLAERMGVIRQGRLVELMQEGKLPKVRAATGFQTVAKRVEDSTRLATFLGGLHRGLDPQEAANRVARLHFDYSDLTRYERDVFRRFAPFYTFSARNLPLQAKTAIRRPGRVPHIAAAIEEGRKATGLAEGYEQGQTPYEQRQLGIPIRWGTNADGTPKIFTVSMGLPFTDLNDLTGIASHLVQGLKGDVLGGAVGAAEVAGQRIAEMAGPWKTYAVELPTNHSFFYRDQVTPETEPYTRAPQWAVDMARKNPYAAKKLGVVFDYQPAERGKGEPATGVPGWPRKIDYAFRNAQPGAIAPILDQLGLGVKGKNARGMGKAARSLAFFGVRAIEYDDDEAKINKLYDQSERIQSEMERLRRRSGADPTLRGGARNATKRFAQLQEQDSAIQAELHDLNVKTRAPTGGLVEGERVGPEDLKPTGATTLSPAAQRRVARAQGRAQSPGARRAMERRIARAQQR